MKPKACPGQCRCGVRCPRPRGHEGSAFTAGTGVHTCDTPKPPIRVAPVSESEYRLMDGNR